MNISDNNGPHTVGDFLEILSSPNFKHSGSRGGSAIYSFFTRHHEPTVRAITEALGGKQIPHTREYHEIAAKIVCAIPLKVLVKAGLFDPKSPAAKKISNCGYRTKREMKEALEKFAGESFAADNLVLQIRDGLSSIRSELIKVTKLVDELEKVQVVR